MPGLKTRPPSGPSLVDAWLEALHARHTAALTTPEFLKAVRALSARYVEARSRLPDRSPIDSAGKRAAFGAFYAPLHFLTTREIARALRSGQTGATGAGTILDLGCGSGVASAAWALEQDAASSLRGVDMHPWVLAEAQWNWRQLGLTGTARRGDLVDTATRLAAARPSAPSDATTILLGWSVNELESTTRQRLLAALTHLVARGVQIVVIEPIARSVSPWWEEWVGAFARLGGPPRADEWKFDLALPPALDRVNDAAGFSTRALSARTIVSRP